MLNKDLMSVRRFIAIWLFISANYSWGAPQPISYGVPQPSIKTIKSFDFDEKKSLALSDFAQRIQPDFHVPEALNRRVSFWFDVYTLYGSNHHVIHHSRYPWMVFEVVDVTEKVNTGKGPLWLRKQRAQKFVSSRKNLTRKVLRDLLRNPRKLPTEQHKRYLAIIKDGPGKSLKRKIRLALNSVRTQLGQKDFFHGGLEQSTYYLPHMEEEFANLGLPTELTRMPFVESSFNTKARSRVGASGIWQIMPRTGKAYLVVNNYVDERNNPIKATRAAGKLLKNYFRALKTWPLTITSYNHGIGNIRKAIRAARSEDLPTIINRYHRGHFKFASSNFYSCFLAALHAEKYHEILFNDIQKLPEKKFVITKLKKAVRTRTLMKKYDLSEERFVRFNLDLSVAVKKNYLLPKGLKVFLPEGIHKPLAANEVKKVRL